MTLQELLATHSDALAGMTPAQKAEYLNTTTTTRVKPQETLIRLRTLYGNASIGPIVAETIMSKLGAVASSQSAMAPIIATVIGWLRGTGETDGVDIANQNTRDMLDSLETSGVLTNAEVASLKALGEDTLTLVEAAGLTEGEVAAHDIERAEANVN